MWKTNKEVWKIPSRRFAPHNPSAEQANRTLHLNPDLWRQIPSALPKEPPRTCRTRKTLHFLPGWHVKVKMRRRRTWKEAQTAMPAMMSLFYLRCEVVPLTTAIVAQRVTTATASRRKMKFHARPMNSILKESRIPQLTLKRRTFLHYLPSGLALYHVPWRLQPHGRCMASGRFPFHSTHMTSPLLLWQMAWLPLRRILSKAKPKHLRRIQTPMHRRQPYRSRRLTTYWLTSQLSSPRRVPLHCVYCRLGIPRRTMQRGKGASLVHRTSAKRAGLPVWGGRKMCPVRSPPSAQVIRNLWQAFKHLARSVNAALPPSAVGKWRPTSSRLLEVINLPCVSV